MRYDRLMTALDKARDRYEAQVRGLIRKMAADDGNVATQILENGKPKNPSKVGFHYKPGTHWTQRPENKGRLRRILKQAARAR